MRTCIIEIAMGLLVRGYPNPVQAVLDFLPHSEDYSSVERQEKAVPDHRSLKGASSYEEAPTPAQLYVDLRHDGDTHSGTVC